MANITRFDPFSSVKGFDPFGSRGEVFRAILARPWGNGVDEEKSEAKYGNGVLEPRLPKKGNGASKQLKVQ